MGNCCSQDLSPAELEAISRNEALTSLQQQDAAKDARDVKLLLLGTGDSGKSTIFKQMQVLHSAGFTREQREQFRAVVRQNVVQALFSLVTAVRKLQLQYASQVRISLTLSSCR